MRKRRRPQKYEAKTPIEKECAYYLSTATRMLADAAKHGRPGYGQAHNRLSGLRKSCFKCLRRLRRYQEEDDERRANIAHNLLFWHRDMLVACIQQLDTWDRDTKTQAKETKLVPKEGGYKKEAARRDLVQAKEFLSNNPDYIPVTVLPPKRPRWMIK